MGFWEALGDLALAIGNPPEYERRLAARKAAAAPTSTQQPRRGGAGRVAKGVVSAGIALHGAAAQPEQDSTTTQRHWGQGAAIQEEGHQGRQARGGTRDKGRSRTSGSSQ